VTRGVSACKNHSRPAILQVPAHEKLQVIIFLQIADSPGAVFAGRNGTHKCASWGIQSGILRGKVIVNRLEKYTQSFCVCTLVQNVAGDGASCAVSF
jgi:hypothetical protein